MNFFTQFSRHAHVNYGKMYVRNAYPGVSEDISDSGCLSAGSRAYKGYTGLRKGGER
jgi:hypothetical protein